MVFSLFKRKKHKEEQQASCAADAAVEDVEGEVHAGDEPAADETPVEFKEKNGFLSKLRRGLAKTREFLTTDIEDLFSGRQKIDDELLEELEALLIMSDMGVETTTKLMDQLSVKAKQLKTADELKTALKEGILRLLDTESKPADSIPTPYVILVVGVNGVGKTTTIGKIASKYSAGGKKVLIGAADTFRAAAIEQLSIWADRAGADIIKHKDHADPAAVAYDSIEAALTRGTDVVLIDTAGRLHTKVNLMEELKKIKRTIAKRLPGAPHEILLVLDATTGQNALSQAKLFDDALEVTGIALTKLDGTAKGGIVVGICHTLQVPLRYVGVGEHLDDLQDFSPEAFVEALF